MHKYGNLDHRVNFNPNLRSVEDFVYKHSISTAILTAMITHKLGMSKRVQQIIVAASLLYDFGYRFVPRQILTKSDEEMTQMDYDTIQTNLERGLGYMYMYNTGFDFMKKAVTLIEYYIYSTSPDKGVKRPDPSILTLMGILKIADHFDQKTGMNINHEPESEIKAMQYLEEHTEDFDQEVVEALAQCIHIVPTGASVDLNTKDKAIVLVENAENYMEPLILRLSNNMLYDLSDPTIRRHVQIVDIMKTMDNRVEIDEETLKHFTSDANIRETAERFKRRKREMGA